MLLTPRLHLRLMTPEDAPFYLRLVNTEDWLHFIGDKAIHTLPAAREAIVQGFIEVQNTHGFSFYLVERSVDHEPLGICGLVKREGLRDVDLGYAFLPEHYGQGYALEAAHRVCAHALEDLGLTHLCAITHLDHARSMHLLKKLGMRDAGTIAWGKGEILRLFELDLGTRSRSPKDLAEDSRDEIT